MLLLSSQSEYLITNRLIVNELDYDTAFAIQEFQTLHTALNAEKGSIFSSFGIA